MKLYESRLTVDVPIPYLQTLRSVSGEQLPSLASHQPDPLIAPEERDPGPMGLTGKFTSYMLL